MSGTKVPKVSARKAKIDSVAPVLGITLFRNEVRRAHSYCPTTALVLLPPYFTRTLPVRIRS